MGVSRHPRNLQKTYSKNLQLQLQNLQLQLQKTYRSLQKRAFWFSSVAVAVAVAVASASIKNNKSEAKKCVSYC
jgi:hypothetical protein